MSPPSCGSRFVAGARGSVLAERLPGGVGGLAADLIIAARGVVERAAVRAPGAAAAYGLDVTAGALGAAF